MRASGEAGNNSDNVVSVPAPIGGWNTRDPLAAMKPTDAIVLDNIFPQSSDVILRKGFVPYASVATGDALATLLAYNAPTGTNIMFGASDNGIYEITADTQNSVPDVALTSGAVQSTMITTAGGSFLWCCNGADKAMYYDGFAWVVLDGTSTPALTGVTSTAVVNLSLFKSRLFLVCNNSLSIWYLPVNSIAGAAAEFPLGAIFRKGGYVVATESWTLDGGDGSDDRFVIITSEGEVAIYVGIDPSNAATWALVGVYQLAAPTGRRCFIRLGSELGVMTASGLLPLSKAIIAFKVSKSSVLSDKVQNSFSEYYQSGKIYDSWCMALFSDYNMLIMNVPINATISYQFVMNTLTGAWCRFTNMNATHYFVFDGLLFFCNGNQIYRAWVGESDNGDLIVARVRQAYSNLGYPARIKRIQMLRMLMAMTNPTSVRIAIDADYTNELNVRSTAGSIGVSGSVWDTARWDEATWAGYINIAQWRKVFHKHGHTLSLRIEFSAKQTSLTWTATNFIIEPGGML